MRVEIQGLCTVTNLAIAPRISKSEVKGLQFAGRGYCSKYEVLMEIPFQIVLKYILLVMRSLLKYFHHVARLNSMRSIIFQTTKPPSLPITIVIKQLALSKYPNNWQRKVYGYPFLSIGCSV